MARLKLATVWLGGCSGCHMSFVDLDEWLIDLVAQVDLVFSPFVDTKEYPQRVDVVLVEGAIANEEHLQMIQTVRERSQILNNNSPPKREAYVSKNGGSNLFRILDY